MSEGCTSRQFFASCSSSFILLMNCQRIRGPSEEVGEREKERGDGGGQVRVRKAKGKQ